MPSGLYHGTVVRTGGGIYVRVSRLGRAHVYGPVNVVTGTTTATAVGDHGAHAHTEQVLAVGDRVLVGFVEGRPDDVVILGRVG